MPEKSTTPAAKAEPTKEVAKAEAAEPAPEETTYPRDQLVAESQELLKTPGFITAGGLALLDGDGDVTLAQAEQAIKDFGEHAFDGESDDEEGN